MAIGPGLTGDKKQVTLARSRHVVSPWQLEIARKIGRPPHSYSLRPTNVKAYQAISNPTLTLSSYHAIELPNIRDYLVFYRNPSSYQGNIVFFPHLPPPSSRSCRQHVNCVCHNRCSPLSDTSRSRFACLKILLQRRTSVRCVLSPQLQVYILRRVCRVPGRAKYRRLTKPSSPHLPHQL
ncbi:hypothetical protein C8Q70DRAFT_509049 [Cubamyces menziesii]|nr:hypothetical protein C8Q70DRAFT_509049 [Cubamyces menziesii]